jgi:hypothetical protein
MRMIKSAFELTSNTVEWCARLSDHGPTSFVLGEDFDAEFSGKGRRQRIDFALGNVLSKAWPDNASYVQWRCKRKVEVSGFSSRIEFHASPNHTELSDSG